jgi:undecaprenyl-diphosphatase
MGAFEAFLFGLVQGATEYLPVSSSAHLLLLPHLLQSKDPGLAFDVFLHVGTLLATAIYFLKDWLLILKNPVPNGARPGRLSWVHLIIGTLPAVIAGATLNGWISAHTRALWILWVTLPLFGLLLWQVDRVRPSNRSIGEAGIKDLFLIGCMQMLALVPGVSRSGSTITAARMLGFARGDSARISFLLSLPITLGAVVHEARHFDELLASIDGFQPLLIGAGTALLSGALAIHLLIKWVSRTSYAVFAVYRVLAAILIALFLGAN